jgi:hypothetical protein
MRKQLTFLLALCHMYAFGQEFRCIVPDTVHYFQSAAGTLVGLRVDSTDVDGTDSVFYFHREFRFRYHPSTAACSWSDTSGYSIPVDLYGPSWLGLKVVEKPDGRSTFFNYKEDSIFINPTIGIGGMWPLFIFEDGSSIQATVTELTSQLILGVEDSTKVITLQHLDNQGLPVAGPWNGTQWKLSQHHGLVQVHSLYMFPVFERLEYYHLQNWDFTWEEMRNTEMIDTTVFSLSAFAPLTMGEMFNYEIGAFYQTSSWDFQGGDSPPGFVSSFREYHVNSRIENGSQLSYSINNDTFTITDVNMPFPNNNFPFQYTNSDYFGYFHSPSSIIVNGITVVGQPILPQPSGTSILDSCGIRQWSFYQFPTEIEANGIDSVCFVSPQDALEFKLFERIIGMEFDYANFESNYYTWPSFAEFSSCDFGSRRYVGIDEHQQALLLRPNPTSSLLRFTTEATSPYSITDMLGRTVQRGMVQQGSNDVQVAALPDGIYLFRLEGSGSSARFVKAGQ